MNAVLSLLQGGCPVKSIYDLQAEYRGFLHHSCEKALDLGLWLPSFHQCTRPLVPGELCVIMADTGVGKSAVLSNIAHSVRSEGLTVLMFHLELPGTLVFERMMAMANGIPQAEIEARYQNEEVLNVSKLDHIYVCDRTRLTYKDMKVIISIATEKREKPDVVMIDYVGLMDAHGSRSRYERMSSAAEDMKVLAKETNTVVVAATQVHRKEENQGDQELSLHDARDSSSIEASAGLLLGLWRDSQDKTLLNIKVLKNTKGTGGRVIPCNFDGSTMVITERVEEAHWPTR